MALVAQNEREREQGEQAEHYLGETVLWLQHKGLAIFSIWLAHVYPGNYSSRKSPILAA